MSIHTQFFSAGDFDLWFVHCLVFCAFRRIEIAKFHCRTMAGFCCTTEETTPLAPCLVLIDLTATFYSAVYMLRQIRRPSVSPSVLDLSVTLRYCVKTRERREMRSSPSGRPRPIVPRLKWQQEGLLLMTAQLAAWKTWNAHPSYRWSVP